MYDYESMIVIVATRNECQVAGWAQLSFQTENGLTGSRVGCLYRVSWCADTRVLFEILSDECET